MVDDTTDRTQPLYGLFADGGKAEGPERR